MGKRHHPATRRRRYSPRQRLEERERSALEAERRRHEREPHPYDALLDDLRRLA